MTGIHRFNIRTNTVGWDKELLQLGFAHPFQSTAFGDCWKIKGFNPLYVEITSGGVAIGKCLVFADRNGLASWYQGPVVRKESLADYAMILAGLVEFLRGLKLIFLSSASTQTVYEKDYFQSHFPEFSGQYEAPFIDLEQDLETIEKGYERSLKKNIRKCEEANVGVEFTGDPLSLRNYGEMLAYHRGRMGLGLPDLHPNVASMKIFNRPYLGMELALASVEGKLLAGLGFVTFGRVVIEIAAAQSEEYHEKKLPAYELLKVKAVSRYKAMGMRLYDLQGVRRTPPTEKETNIRRFKLKFTQSLGEFGLLENKVILPIGWAKFRLRNKLGMLARRVLARHGETKHG